MTASDLLAAISAVADAKTRSEALAAKLAEIQGEAPAVAAELEAAEGELADVQALAHLGEATTEQVAALRAVKDSKRERARAIVSACRILEQRITAQSEAVLSLERKQAAIMAELARPLALAARDEAARAVRSAAESLRLLAQLDNAQRNATGFLTGAASQILFGHPEQVFAAHGLRCDGVYPHLRESSDSITAEQLLALL